MDRTATETVIRFLCDQFGVKMPSLTFRRNASRSGRYFPGRRPRICVAKQAPTWVVAHEFAHHLHQANHRRVIQEGHDQSFYWVLRRVIDAIGITDYPWKKEYKQVRRWAEKDGLPA